MHSIKSKKTQNYRFDFLAIGTSWSIETTQELSDSLKEIIASKIEAFDKTYSRFGDDSQVSRIAEKKGEYTFPKGDSILFDMYDTLFRVSNGKVSPLIGAALEDLGYDKTYSLRAKSRIRDTADYGLVQRTGTTITTREPLLFDFGAAGKGYLVDLISTILDESNVSDYVIDASGDIRHKGSEIERVGLENPYDSKKVVGVIELQNRALCGSAVNRRKWGNGLHHVLDATSGKPVEGIIATWVVADTALVADGLATALFFCRPNELAVHYNYEYMTIHESGAIEASSFFKEGLFI